MIMNKICGTLLGRNLSSSNYVNGGSNRELKSKSQIQVQEDKKICFQYIPLMLQPFQISCLLSIWIWITWLGHLLVWKFVISFEIVDTGVVCMEKEFGTWRHVVGLFVQFRCCPALLFQRDPLFILNFVGSGHCEESTHLCRVWG
jgi:hypothetical protein